MRNLRIAILPTSCPKVLIDVAESVVEVSSSRAGGPRTWVQDLADHLEVRESYRNHGVGGVTPDGWRRSALDFLEHFHGHAELPDVNPTLKDLNLVLER